jgi:hypothetical protein
VRGGREGREEVEVMDTIRGNFNGDIDNVDARGSLCTLAPPSGVGGKRGGEKLGEREGGKRGGRNLIQKK